MAKTGLLAAMAGISGLLTTTQVAAANGLADQIGLTAAGVVGLGWLAFLAVLAFAIILPLIRDQAAASGLRTQGTMGDVVIGSRLFVLSMSKR